MDSLLRKLFRGDLSPYENPAPDSEKYRNAVKKQQEAQNALRSSLTGDQTALLDSAYSLGMEIAVMELEKVYGDGIRFGVRLMMELFPMGPDA